MNAFCVLALLLLASPCFSKWNCTLSNPLPDKDSASGPEVVNTVLERLECSGIFEDDHRFMRRLAYVQTRDGDERGNKTGIWNITEDRLINMVRRIRNNYEHLEDKVCQQFNINITSAVTTSRARGNPLVSGVLARFYLHYVTVEYRQQIPSAENVSGQAAFWISHFRNNAEAGTKENFTNNVTYIEGLCQCSSRTCPSLPLLPEDWMNRDDANGSCVVEAVLQQLNDSHIFPPDHGFMRRIAYVETRDGAEQTHENVTETGCYKRVGIWGLTSFILDTMKNDMGREEQRKDNPELENVSEHICRVFGVNMTGHEKLNLRNPLVSGIAARFYIFYLTVVKPSLELPETVAGQANFWQREYRKDDQFTKHVTFEERVMELEGCRVNADIMFVLDISDSVTNDKTNLGAMLDFVTKFVENLPIGPLDDRVGAVVFGDSSHVMFTMTEHDNKNDLLHAIKGLVDDIDDIKRDDRVQQTNTAQGLNETLAAFQSDTRPSDTVFRVAIVVSDGQSDDTDATIEEAKKLHTLTPRVHMYAIGIGTVDVDEMNAIAGDRNNYTRIDGFDPSEFNIVRCKFLKDICLNAIIDINELKSLNGELDEKEIMRYVRFVPANGLTIRLCSSEGRVTASVFCYVPEDSGKVISIKPICDHRNSTNCECIDVYIPESASSSQEHSRRRARRETVTIEVHITVEGMETENVFVMDTTDGDDPNDCAGMEVASDCIKLDPEDFNTPPSVKASDEHSEDSSAPQSETKVTGSPGASKGLSKKTVVIAATVSSTGFILICCIVIVSSVGGWVLYRRRKQQQREKMEEEVYRLLDNEYVEM